MKSKTIMHTVFSEFEAGGISYCHFKSNQHLDISFDGASDFDVLVDSAKVSEVSEVLYRNGAKRFETSHINNYPGIENWLVFDPKSGIIYHLHLHYQLLTGRTHVKEYVIPWYPYVLETAVRDEQFGIFISNPNVEILLLLTRLVLKNRKRKVCKAYMKNRFLTGDMKNEFEYLCDRIDPASVRSASDYIYGESAYPVFEAIINARSIDRHKYRLLCAVVKESVRDYKLYSSFNVYKKYYEEVLYTRYSRRLRKKGGFPDEKKKPQSQGLSIVFVGVDGAGKSTVSREIYKWLSNKIETQKVYLGVGDGKKAFGVRSCQFLAKGFRFLFKKTGNQTDYDKSGAVRRFLFRKAELYKARAILAAVKGNRKKLMQISAYRSKGGIAVMDRYPQIEVPDINDGPKIRTMGKRIKSGKLLQMAEKEEKLLEIVKTHKPDMVFKLMISLDECMNRKTEHTDRAYYSQKIESVRALSFMGCPITEVDAMQPYEEEILEIKKIIWNMI